MRFPYKLIALLIGASVIGAMTYVSVRSQQPFLNEQQQVTAPITWDNMNKISGKITVLIDSSSSGSGVIIAKNNNFFIKTYYVLTANHVVQGGNKIDIITYDGKRHHLDHSTVKQLPGVDLAVLQFTSTQTYRVATLANYQLNEGQKPTLVLVSGWSLSKQGGSETRNHLFNPGVLSTKDRGRMFAMDSVPFSDGYDLVYTNLTGAGVSGGPVLDVSGRVIGIHGRAEAEVTVDEAGKRHQLQLGHSLGIPISTFLKLVSQVGIDTKLLQVKASSSSHAEQEFTSIYKTVINLANKATEQIETRSSHCLTFACEKKLANKGSANQKATNSRVSAVDWLNYGNQMSRVLLPEFALEAYNQSIQLKPDFYPAWYARGLLMLRIKGDNQEAFQSFDKVTQIEPTFYPAWRGRGSALSKLKRYKEAVQSYNRAIQLNPNDLTLQQRRDAMLRELQPNP
jgi:tetratricopeptide (TPR) repeat protein